MIIQVSKIDFDTILPIWNIHLWPNRKTEIKPLSSIRYMGGYDMSIYNYTPTFLAAFIDDKIVGVNSGFKTSQNHYRSRGIFVFPEYRSLGVAQHLFLAIEDQAKQEGCNLLWSIPRKTAVISYLKFGFKITSPWFDENMEFGPNCYVCKSIV